MPTRQRSLAEGVDAGNVDAGNVDAALASTALSVVLAKSVPGSSVMRIGYSFRVETLVSQVWARIADTTEIAHS